MIEDGILVALGGIWGLLAGLGRLGAISLALAHRRLRQPADAGTAGDLSVIIPVEQAPHDFAENLVALYAQAGRRFEVLISARDSALPALALARSVSTQARHVETGIIAAPNDIALSPKLNNLVAPLSDAKNDLIMVVDANVRLASGQLAAIIRHHSPGVGLVAVVPVAWSADGLVADMEAALMNAYQAPLLLAIAALGFGVGNGKVMVFDRRDLARAGGIPALADSIAEDHCLSNALRRIGLRTVLATEQPAQHLGRRTLRDVWHRHLRWMIARRDEAPAAYWLEPLGSPLLSTSAGAIAVSALTGLSSLGAWIGLYAGWLLADVAFLAAKGWRIGATFPLAALMRDIMNLAVWIVALRAHSVQWGGQMRPVRRRASDDDDAQPPLPRRVLRKACAALGFGVEDRTSTPPSRRSHVVPMADDADRPCDGPDAAGHASR